MRRNCISLCNLFLPICFVTLKVLMVFLLVIWNSTLNCCVKITDQTGRFPPIDDISIKSAGKTGENNHELNGALGHLRRVVIVKCKRPKELGVAVPLLNSRWQEIFQEYSTKPSSATSYQAAPRNRQPVGKPPDFEHAIYPKFKNSPFLSADQFVLHSSAYVSPTIKSNKATRIMRALNDKLISVPRLRNHSIRWIAWLNYAHNASNFDVFHGPAAAAAAVHPFRENRQLSALGGRPH